MNLYTTRDDAIHYEITLALGEYADEHDIDAIADRVLIGVGEGVYYRIIRDPDIDEDEFWDIVAANERSR